MKKACIFPGSFDPFTLGHLDILRRAAALFDEVVAAVLTNPEKSGWLAVERRMDLIRLSAEGLAGVRVIQFTGLLADCARREGISVVVRGLRGPGDLPQEAAMAHLNHHLNPALETIFLAASPHAAHISASAVRQIARFGGALEGLVHPAAVKALQPTMRGD